MKTSQYFIDDAPLQILLLDNSPDDGRIFFDKGLGGAWFDYDLHVIEEMSEAAPFLELKNPNRRNLDLLLISNGIWFQGGEQLVRQIRCHPALSCLPIYCIVSCAKKLSNSEANCWNPAWRIETDCNKDSGVAAIPFEHNKTPDHPARIDGTICANNIGSEIPRIIDALTDYWFQSAKA